MTGIILGIIAACCWAASAIFARLGMSSGIKYTTGTLISMISSFLVVFVIAVVFDITDFFSISLTAVFWFGLIGLVNYVIGRQLNYASIDRIGVVRASPLFATAPLWAMVLAVTFINETVNVPIVLGTLTIVAGTYLVVTSQ
jgi:drug/metabolite transporter (DMT)-like permease